MLPAILSLSGPVLTNDERALLSAADPAGFILFARNCLAKVQMRALTDSLRELAGRDDLLILIDQEGGRVARLRPPEWPHFPAPGRFADLYARAPFSGMEAARVNALAIALTLREVGVNVDCLPVLDVPQAGAHAIIGDRALGGQPMQVAALGRMILDGLAQGGVAGIVKHMPGHGRARSDSHLELPVVDASPDEMETDIAPFRSLAARARIGMTAHIHYPAWGAENPATLSRRIIGEVIRGLIGFEGLLLTDDIGMEALSGPVEARGAAALAAGCDIVLHCSGELDEMHRLAATLPPITQATTDRLSRALKMNGAPDDAPPLAELLATRDALLAVLA